MDMPGVPNIPWEAVQAMEKLYEHQTVSFSARRKQGKEDSWQF
jgi:hypothetical protein